jgi:hypothetical protein
MDERSREISMRALRTFVALSSFSVMLLGAGSAQAVWQIYGTGEFGYSIGKGQISGITEILTLPATFEGSAEDVSPMVAGAIGIQIPINELTPWRMPGNIRLPDWPFRFEIQFAGVREYQYETVGEFPGSPAFHTDVEIWSLMNNFWFDISLAGLHRPIALASGKIAGRPRLSGLKRFLEPASFYFGAGIGFADLKLRTSDSVLSASDESIDFAFQAGAGFGYQLTERLNLGVGYRYFNPGTRSTPLYGSAGEDRGEFNLKSDIHEVSFAFRVYLVDLPYPWR